MSQKEPQEESDLRRKLRERMAQQEPAKQQSQPARRPPTPKPQQPPRRPPAGPPKRPQVGRPPAAPSRSRRRPLGIYIPWWGILVVVGIVGIATCGVWAFVLTTTPDVTGTGLVAGLTPTFVVITNTPTPGQPEPVEATPENPEQLLTPTVEAPPAEAAPDSEIVVDSEVTIIGTEGDGLAMRQGPGLSYAYFFIGQDGEVFLVEDGPRENDGFIWWYIADPEIPDKGGWAVQDFMELVPEPGPLQEVTPEPTPEPEASG